MALVLLDRSKPDPRMAALSNEELAALALGRAQRPDDVVVVFTDPAGHASAIRDAPPQRGKGCTAP